MNLSSGKAHNPLEGSSENIKKSFVYVNGRERFDKGSDYKSLRKCGQCQLRAWINTPHSQTDWCVLCVFKAT
jgi:hypothetical protein